MLIILLSRALSGGRSHVGETRHQGAHANLEQPVSPPLGSHLNKLWGGQDLACWYLESRLMQLPGTGGWDGCQGLEAKLQT